MDQMGCATGGVISIDFRDNEHPVVKQVKVDLDAAGYALCIIDSGASHADLTGDYAAVPQEMGAVAAFFGKEVLSQVDPAVFYERLPEVRAACGDRAVLRAIHFFDDDAVVDREREALERGDFDLYLAEVRLTADFDLTQLVGTRGGLNYGGWSDPATDGLLSAFRAAGAELRSSAAASLCSHLIQNAPIVPICFKNGSVLTQWGRLSGLDPVRDNVFHGLENWVLDP